jgi:glycosyltransferase involved in cell wall biosynthesis
MALGVPLVATSVCLPGLQLEAGKHLLVADTPEEFASAIELLIDDPSLRDRLIEAGRAYVERHHNWSESVKALATSYDRAVVEFANRSGQRNLSRFPLAG